MRPRPPSRGPCAGPRCDAQPGSPCRSRSGAVAGTYHTGHFIKVPRLAKLLRVPTPSDRSPGRPTSLPSSSATAAPNNHSALHATSR
ncbi:zinc finger domain-containing protein [Streptomyces atratus]